jgi:colanic acid/amylovoran biosynthesis glycosyltransferase
MSRYPAISHTFFLQEIVGLRALGFSIEPASINRPDRPPGALSKQERAESERTYYLKGQSAARLILSLLRIALTHPRVAFRGLVASLKLEPWHLSHTIYALFYWAEALLLGDWMNGKRLRHLHIHFSGPVASVGMLTSLAWRIPYSLTVHGPDEFFDQNETALPQKIKNASFVVCISEFCRSQLMRISDPATWKKLHVVRLGILPELADTTSKLPLSNATGRNQSTQLHVLCTGRLVGAKGQAILMLAAAALIERGHRLKVTFIGDGVDRANLEQLVDASGIRDAIVFTGAQSHAQVLEALRISDLFVLPSFAEGVPVALMEAMAIGVPCISTFIAGIPELIRHEEDGLLVPAGSVEGLTAAIERMILHPEERDKFRKAAREHVLAEYNLPENLKTLAATMTSLAPYAVRSDRIPGADE